ncbi:Cupredoxin [Chiua virens]|nr:Cupredoxin [Chiua virens]
MPRRSLVFSGIKEAKYEQSRSIHPNTLVTSEMLLLPLVVLSLFLSNALSIPPPQASGSTDDSIVAGNGVNDSGIDGSLASIPHPQAAGSADENGVDGSVVDDSGTNDAEEVGSLASISHPQASGSFADDGGDPAGDGEADDETDDDDGAGDDPNTFRRPLPRPRPGPRPRPHPRPFPRPGRRPRPGPRPRPRPGPRPGPGPQPPTPGPQPVQTLVDSRELSIVNREIAPDGFSRSAVLADGVFPGPTISLTKGHQAAIRVTNQLTNNSMDVDTDIHWHGIFQTNTNWADGVPWVTECPIKPQKSFVYRFNVGQTGTHWYHSHFGIQYCDGLRGPLIIYDPNDPHKGLYDVDDANTVITLSDWYHTLGPELGEILGNVDPDSTLINGRGRYPGNLTAPLAVVNVQPGLRYRFRVISMSCDPWFNFTIDGHRMTIIEVDGSEVQPVQVDSIPILAGQRYSVVVTANQPPGNYWIRASTNKNGNFTGGINSAILRYAGQPSSEPTSKPGPYQLTFNEGGLHPLIDPAAPGNPGIGNADVSIQLAPSLDNSTRLWQINNVTWSNPPTPVLLQILKGNLHPAQLLPSGSIYELPPNKVIEINFPFPSSGFLPGGPHPIHLHGHEFSVVRVAGSNTPNFVNPVRRDVVSMGTNVGDNVTIRFRTDNPGPWIIHCHIDWHLHHGFAVVMAESTAQASQLQPPVDWRQLCQA